MINLTDFVIIQEINRIYEQTIVDDIMTAMRCWHKTNGILFESNKYEFEGCGKVMSVVDEYVYNLDEQSNHSKKFDCSNYNTFFKTLHIEFKFGNDIHGIYLKAKSNNSELYLELYLLSKPFVEYNEKEIGDFQYTLLHELSHGYKTYLDNLENKDIVSELLNKQYSNEYQKALNRLLRSKYEDFHKIIARCRYFLDEDEKFAYLAILSKSVKNITNKNKPSFEDPKFDELIETIKSEYIWSEYVNISAFIDSINKLDENNQRKLVQAYNLFYKTDYDFNKIKDMLKNQWEDFKKEFIDTYMDSYIEYFNENVVLESFISIPKEMLDDPYSKYN